jgi:hypothetical protein
MIRPEINAVLAVPKRQLSGLHARPRSTSQRRMGIYILVMSCEDVDQLRELPSRRRFWTEPAFEG